MVSNTLQVPSWLTSPNTLLKEDAPIVSLSPKDIPIVLSADTFNDVIIPKDNNVEIIIFLISIPSLNYLCFYNENHSSNYDS